NAFVKGGNSFGVAATLGTADNFNLAFNSNNLTRMTVLNGGAVVIGTTAATTGSQFEVQGGAITAGPKGAGAGNGGEVRFYELTANGANYMAFKAADSLAGNVTWTLPNVIGSAAQVLASDGAGTLTWATPVTTANAFIKGGNS